MLCLGEIKYFISRLNAAAVFLPIATAVKSSLHLTHFKKHFTDDGDVKIKIAFFGKSNSLQGLHTFS
jgi:hypothetical protein